MNQKQAADKIESIYDQQTGTWASADWTHEYKVDGEAQLDEDGETVYCSGQDDCSVCAQAKDDADACEDFAQEAVEAAREGDLQKALKFAEQAASLEYTWGDHPTWRPLAKAIEEILEEGIDVPFQGSDWETFSVGGVEFEFSLDSCDTNDTDPFFGWTNGTVKLGKHLISVGGGWILNEAEARIYSDARGVVKIAGDLDAYQYADAGKVDEFLEALIGFGAVLPEDGDKAQQEVVECLQAASRKLYQENR